MTWRNEWCHFYSVADFNSASAKLATIKSLYSGCRFSVCVFIYFWVRKFGKWYIHIYIVDWLIAAPATAMHVLLCHFVFIFIRIYILHNKYFEPFSASILFANCFLQRISDIHIYTHTHRKKHKYLFQFHNAFASLPIQKCESKALNLPLKFDIRRNNLSNNKTNNGIMLLSLA